jgi:hypothetical protein
MPEFLASFSGIRTYPGELPQPFGLRLVATLRGEMARVAKAPYIIYYLRSQVVTAEAEFGHSAPPTAIAA